MTWQQVLSSTPTSFSTVSVLSPPPATTAPQQLLRPRRKEKARAGRGVVEFSCSSLLSATVTAIPRPDSLKTFVLSYTNVITALLSPLSLPHRRRTAVNSFSRPMPSCITTYVLDLPRAELSTPVTMFCTSRTGVGVFVRRGTGDATIGLTVGESKTIRMVASSLQADVATIITTITTTPVKRITSRCCCCCWPSACTLARTSNVRVGRRAEVRRGERQPFQRRGGTDAGKARSQGRAKQKALRAATRHVTAHAEWSRAGQGGRNKQSNAVTAVLVLMW